MRRVAFLFPGQGSQAVGMGRGLVGSDPFADGLLSLASEAAGQDLARVCLRGPDRLLAETRFLQPALVAVCLALWRRLSDAGVEARAVAGHSLGEIAALAAAGFADPEGAVAMAAARGRLMDAAARERPGAMIAVGGLALEEVERALAGLGERGVLAIAAVNAPTQIAVSGDRALVEEAARRIAAAPSGRATPLRVSGAWHCEHMRPAVAPFLEVARDRLGPSSGAGPLLILGRYGREPRSGEDLAEIAARQLVEPLRWDLAMARIAAEGITDLVEVGPGRVLRGLARLNVRDPDVRAHGASDARSADATAKALT